MVVQNSNTFNFVQNVVVNVNVQAGPAAIFIILVAPKLAY